MTFGRLRELVHRPSHEGWAALCELLEGVDDEAQLRHELLPYALSMLERWPAHYRQMPLSWFAAPELPQLAVVREIDYDEDALGDLDPLLSALDNPDLGRLRALSWRGRHREPLDDRALYRLVAASAMAQLERLVIARGHLHPMGWEILLKGLPLENLRELRLDHIESTGLQMLLRRELPQLRRLDLRQAWYHTIQSPLWRGLAIEHLSFRMDLDPEAMPYLVAALGALPLRSLEMGTPRWGDEHIYALQYETFPALEHLGLHDLDEVRIDTLCDFLCGTRNLARIESLTLDHCSVQALHSRHAVRLHELERLVWRLAGDVDGNVEFASHWEMPRLRALRVDNDHHLRVTEALTRPGLRHLEILELGGQALMSPTDLLNLNLLPLRELRLESMCVSERDWARLTRHRALRHLERLHYRPDESAPLPASWREELPAREVVIDMREGAWREREALAELQAQYEGRLEVLT